MSDTSARRTTQHDPALRALVAGAFESLGGPAMLLDEKLRVIVATSSAERVLGGRMPQGAHVVKLLCGGATTGPVADALAEHRPVVALVPRLRHTGVQRFVRMRATPILSRGRPLGWLIALAEEPPPGHDAPWRLGDMWTCDPTMQRLFRLAEHVAGWDVSVLLEGEMGTGKASFAAAIHALSRHRTGPLHTLQCGAATPAQLERVLIGQESAGDGTVFLDGVQDMPAAVQAELLRALESGFVTPRDGGAPTPVSGRVIASTHVSLQEEIEAGRFRADLGYRLRVVSMHLPPLRARQGDVRLLVDKTVAALNQRGGRQVEQVSPAAMARLEQHAWPGNVRELLSVLESAFATGDGPVLSVTELPADLTDHPAPGGPVVLATAHPAHHDDDTAARIRQALARAGGDRGRAATMLGMSRTTLWRRMRALGLVGGGR